VKVLNEVSGQEINDTDIWYEIDGGKYPHAYIFSDLVTPLPQPQPPKKLTIPEEVQKGDCWIDVDIAKKILTLFDYDKPALVTYISTGKEETPTLAGTFKVWYKLRKAAMKGGPPLVKQKYNLKNVPSVMYYENSYAIHGTYWGDKFGTPQSAGCINVTQGDAAFIFEKTKPNLSPDENSLFSSKDNPGTVVYSHE
jgi:lipoprotein-anchoring transpeptidase ErfK/SrfK